MQYKHERYFLNSTGALYRPKFHNVQKERYLNRSVGGGSGDPRTQRSEPFRRGNRGNGLEAALRPSRTPRLHEAFVLDPSVVVLQAPALSRRRFEGTARTTRIANSKEIGLDGIRASSLAGSDW